MTQCAPHVSPPSPRRAICATKYGEGRRSSGANAGSVAMQFVCEAPPKTWFRIETEGEAALESRAMNHAVEKYFKQAYEQATKSYVPPRSAPYIEQNIGLKAHIQRVMPLFLTLRDAEGNTLVTAMLPPIGRDERSF